MILIDALFINNGGGKVLLDYLIEEIEKKRLKVHYLLDDRIKNTIPEISICNKVSFLQGNIFKRHHFYKVHKNDFSKVLCFANLPPTIRLNTEVYTYFHQLIYINIPTEFSFLDQVKFRLKRIILKIFAKNTNFWIVQSNLTKNKFGLKFSFNENLIKVLPFYPHFSSLNVVSIKNKNSYLYVSNANPHKNHTRLINAFCVFYEKYKIGQLILTVNKYFPEVLALIDLKQKSGYPIKNIGFVNREELEKEYQKSEFLIFPSLTESFGLGLIEGIECGCKIIAADLPYTYAVCEPSVVFDPLKEESIFKAFETSLNYYTNLSTPKINNKINELINILENSQCN
ncbi:glycosyltransferase [Flavobacterium cellulosilyticum]|uniref:Glycosyltransferase n=1 Tax=Flavobacterium cellulosilyticum TaxID=2541731 RepID=A0A4R5CE80_9FLAO|nr:glycosyltransferase [Flavobacterium cellulosilyticum]TDD98361.1 glycosyltransferase [Flavobacterium cellulosilyticum]